MEKWRFQNPAKSAGYNFPNYMKETWVPMEWTIQRKNRAGMEVSLKGIPAYTWWSIVGHLASCALGYPFQEYLDHLVIPLLKRMISHGFNQSKCKKLDQTIGPWIRGTLLQLIPEIQPHICSFQEITFMILAIIKKMQIKLPE